MSRAIVYWLLFKNKW